MPYKPTGRPNGRPRKVQPAPEPVAEPVEPKKLTRARAQFRKHAERMNPNPFVVALDSRGRPRHKPRHFAVKV